MWSFLESHAQWASRFPIATKLVLGVVDIIVILLLRKQIFMLFARVFSSNFFSSCKMSAVVVLQMTE